MNVRNSVLLKVAGAFAVTAFVSSDGALYSKFWRKPRPT